MNMEMIIKNLLKDMDPKSKIFWKKLMSKS